MTTTQRVEIKSEIIRLPIPIVGQRVELRQDVDRFPDFVAATGSHGEVSFVSDGFITVRIDDKYWTDGMDTWRGEVHWYESTAIHANGFLVPALLDFHLDVILDKSVSDANYRAR